MLRWVAEFQWMMQYRWNGSSVARFHSKFQRCRNNVLVIDLLYFVLFYCRSFSYVYFFSVFSFFVWFPLFLSLCMFFILMHHKTLSMFIYYCSFFFLSLVLFKCNKTAFYYFLFYTSIISQAALLDCVDMLFILLFFLLVLIYFSSQCAIFSFNFIFLSLKVLFSRHNWLLIKFFFYFIVFCRRFFPLLSLLCSSVCLLFYLLRELTLCICIFRYFT